MLKESYLANLRNLPQDAITIIVTARASILGPSWELLNDYKAHRITWEEYVTRYIKEMQNTACQDEMRRIKALAVDKDVYLVCYEKEYPCHRFILKDLINAI